MNRLTHCTICLSPYLKNVDEMLLKKVPYPVIVAFLKDKGTELSEMSVSRHKKHYLELDKKPRQIQKEKILKTQKKAKERIDKSKEDLSELIKEDIDAITQTKNLMRIKPKNINVDKTIKEASELVQDIDVIREFQYIINIQKERIKNGLKEEFESELTLNSTGMAIKDFAMILAKFHEITSGSESVQKIRFAQLVNMVGNVFADSSLSDKARNELAQLLKGSGLTGKDGNSDNPEESIRPKVIESPDIIEEPSNSDKEIND